jgi:hypothetical protein
MRNFLFLISCPVLVFGFTWFWSTKKEPEECALFLAPSLIPGVQRGIFAGKNYHSKEIVEISPTVAVPSQFIQKLQLFNYAFSSNDPDYSMSVFGSGMLYNHHKTKSNIEYQWNTTPMKNHKILHNIYSKSYSMFPDLRYVANKEIQVGQELYTNYGNDDWFEHREMKVTEDTSASISSSTSSPPPPPHYSLEQLHQSGHCLSNLYLNTSSIPLAGRGVFSHRNYQIGDLVTISPVLILPKHSLEFDSLETSLLYNYCLLSPGSDVAILPIGLGGMINHGGDTLSNVKIDWFHWKTKNHKEEEEPIQKLERSRSASLDVQYIATKEIRVGDELLMSYGDDWEREWLKYFKQIETWETKNNFSRNDLEIILKPQFRHAITAPSSFFPPHFYAAGKCLGLDCSDEKVKEMMTSPQRTLNSRGNPISQASAERALEYFSRSQSRMSH